MTLDVGSPDLQHLRAHEACEGESRCLPELPGQANNPFEESPSCDLFSVLANGAQAMASRGRLVLHVVTSWTEVEVTRAATVRNVVRSLGRLAADVTLMTLQTRLEEQGVHVKVRDQLALLFRQLRQKILQHEVLKVDTDDDGEEHGGFHHDKALAVVEIHTLEPAIDGHGDAEAEQDPHDQVTTEVCLLHQQSVALLNLEKGLLLVLFTDSRCRALCLTSSAFRGGRAACIADRVRQGL
mmetsp:Transcript_39774/g.105366  ORF Transcript_39774/g.105366 Transcript_39774/m.105366 type:complete len:240 (+) Transcript_39774:2037-2756(+)